MGIKTGVVILNYNSNELTASLANRLADYENVDEICVVDNCSRIPFEIALLRSGDKIHFIQNRINSGYNSGNNVGIRFLIEKCSCDYVFIANPDVEFSPNAISSILDAFSHDQQLAICSTLRYGFDREIIHQYFDFPSLRTSLLNCFALGRKKLGRNKVVNQTNLVKYSLDNIIYVDAVPGAFFGMRASFVKQINYLFEGVFLYGEELFVGRQAFELGYKAAIVNSAEYLHLHKHRPFSKSNRKMFYYDRKSLMLYFKKFGLLNLPQRLFLRTAILFGTAEYSVLAFLFSILKKLRGR